MEFVFSMTIPDTLYQELIEAARESRCSPKIFAAQSVESVLASRRLPRVAQGSHGPRIGGREVEEAEPDGYRLSL